MKCVIGIMPTLKNNNKDYFSENYSYVRRYTEKLNEYGSNAIGIMLNKDNLVDNDILEMCDGFLLPGGNKVEKSWYQVIDYCIKVNKPLLGVCLGSEAIAIYSAIKDKLENNYSVDDVIKVYQKLKTENDGTLLRRLEEGNIHSHIVTNDTINTARHNIIIKENTILYDVFKTKEKSVVSLHSYDYKIVGSYFIKSAVAEDNVCEGIEYNNKDYFIVGTHFHDEAEDNSLVIKRLVLECKKRKNIL